MSTEPPMPSPARLARLVALALSTSLPVTAAVAQDVPFAVPATDSGMRFEDVDVSHDRGDYAAALRGWLALNPGRKIVSLSSILAYREGARSFVLGHVPDAAAHQSVDVVDVAGMPAATALTSYANHHARRVVAFTGIPAYGGGVGSFVVVVEPR